MNFQKQTKPLLALIVILLAACSRSAEELETRAQALLAENKLAEAEIEFRKAIQKEASRATAYIGLGETLLALGRSEEAAGAWRNAARSDPKGARPRVLLADLLLSVNLVLGGRAHLVTEASQLLEDLRKLDADSYDRWRLEGALAVAQKEWGHAAEHFRKALPKSPAGDQSVRLALARSLGAAGKLPEARQVIEEQLTADAKWQAGYDALYQLAMASKSFTEALATLERKRKATGEELVQVAIARHFAVVEDEKRYRETLAAIPPQAKPAVHMAAGILERRRRHWDEALAFFQRAAAGSPAEKLEAQKQSIDTLIEARRWEDAKRLLVEVREQNPDDLGVAILTANLLSISSSHQERTRARADMDALRKKYPSKALVRYHWGQFLKREGATNAAATEFREAARLEESAVAPRVALAEIALEAGRGAEASRLADEALRWEPENWSARMIKASAIAQLGQVSQSRQAFADMLRARPNDPEVQVRHGYVLLAENKDSEAEAVFRKLYQPGQEDIRPVVGLAQLMAKRKQFGMAVDLLGKEVATRRDKAPLMKVRARVALAAGMRDLSLEIGQELARLEPKSPEVRLHLSDVLASKGDLAGAISEAKRATEIAPENAFAWRKLGFLQGFHQDWAGAEIAYRKALELEPNAKDARNNLASLLADQGKHLEEAERLARALAQEEPANNDYRDTLAWVLVKRGRLDEALTTLKDLVSRQPENGPIRFHYGAALLASGQKDRARNEFEAARQLPMDPATRKALEESLSATR